MSAEQICGAAVILVSGEEVSVAEICAAAVPLVWGRSFIGVCRGGVSVSVLQKCQVGVSYKSIKLGKSYKSVK